MPEFKQHAAGTFCYCELASADPQVSGKFYMDLFGWGRNDQDLGEFGIYTQFQLDGKTVASQFQLPQEQQQNNVPSNWGQYVAVADADAAAAAAQELGGQLVMGPMDVFDHGRMAVLADPCGAVFSVWQAKENIGIVLRDDPNTMCWNELLTTDSSRATAFYGTLFGWEPKSMEMGELGVYTSLMLGDDQPAAGMMPIRPDMGPIPSHWMVYFGVADLAAAYAAVALAGGCGMVAPTEIPGSGRFAVVSDPVGARFGLYQAAK
jgi:predicted enzyme related to lactoylglutathione lyase